MTRRLSRLARFLRNNSLSLVLIGAFLLMLFGQSVAGHPVFDGDASDAFFVLFGASIVGHAITGAHEYCAEQRAHGESAVSTMEFVGRSLGAIVMLSIVLRQQGSPESKPVHAPHAQTGTS
ncbi:MAG TPA: DUF6766 family protein [Acidimicrobiales bacterium]|nr:DUF6766 family protein [Acidimicrobiales bacterium]